MAAGFTLRVFFYGLIAFAPTKEEDAAAVFVLNAQSLSTPDICVNHRHDPLVGYAAGYLTCLAGDCSTVHDVDEGPNCEAMGWWRLSGQFVELGSSGADSRLHIRDANSKSGLPSLSNADDFGWVAHMFSIDPAASVIDPSILGSSPDSKKIVGRLDLTEGVLQSCQLVADPRGLTSKLRIPLMVFESGAGIDSPQIQALTEIVMLESEIQREFLEITFKGFATSTVLRKVKLLPKECGAYGLNGKCIDIFITNEPVVHPEPHSCRERNLFRAAHFPLYYNISTIDWIPWRLRKIPRWRDEKRRTKDEFFDECFSPILACLPMFDGYEEGSGPLNRPICPPATFGAIDE